LPPRLHGAFGGRASSASLKFHDRTSPSSLAAKVQNTHYHHSNIVVIISNTVRRSVHVRTYIRTYCKASHKKDLSAAINRLHTHVVAVTH